MTGQGPVPDAAAPSPDVSIIVPSWNQGAYLARCLDSVLDQELEGTLEVLVVDGGSTDETVDVLRSYDDPRLRWWSEPDEGIADAVNKGLARARGRIAGIQSSDDYYLPGAVGSALAAFRDHPGLGLVYGDVQSVDVEERVRRVWRRPPHDDATCIGLCVCIPQSSAFFDLELARRVGGWRPEYHTADWDFWIRLMLRAPTVKVDEVWSAWRVYPGQRTDQRRRVLEDYRRMVAESADIAEAPWRVRRAASASRHLIGMSYDRGGRWTALGHLANAVVRWPPLLRHVPEKHRAVPGLRRLRGGRRIGAPGAG